MHEITALTGLRGYAAIWVCLLHYTWGIKGEGFFVGMVRNGSGGLIAFFVLSGFILSYVYAKQFKDGVTGGQYRAFMWARIARVYPLHALTLFAWLALVVIGWIDLWKGDTPYSFLLNLFLLHAWGFTDLVSWNQPSWSISAELFAYLLFPLIIGPLYRAKTFTIAIWLLLALWSASASPYAHLVHYLVRAGVLQWGGQFSHGVSLVNFFSLFAFGVATFCFAERLVMAAPAVRMYDALTLLGIAIFAYACTVPLSTPLLATASAVTIIGLYRDAGVGRLVFGCWPSKFLGDISYALYLSHIMVGIVVTHLMGAALHWGWRLAAAIIVSAALHYAFERPARSLLRRFRPFASQRGAERQQLSPSLRSAAE